MSDCYELNVAGVTRQLPIIPISPELAIAQLRPSWATVSW